MYSCPTRLLLEAAVLGEAPGGRLTDYEAHAGTCPRCRHELNWLRSEAAMFAQRRAREEVGRLWSGVDTSRPRVRRWSRMAVAVAASVLLALVASGRRGPSSGRENLPMSLETMSVDRRAGSDSAQCYTPGFGIACDDVVLASR